MSQSRPEVSESKDSDALSSATHPGGRLPDAIPRPAETPPRLDGYEELERIGEGGMGVVYRARDTQLKRLVALKMTRADRVTPERLARFRTEAEALARLSHPHIVQLFAWAEQDGRPLLVMEYVPGGTLEDVLRRGPMPHDEAARLVAILARAAQAAHEAGVVHRDLKPANVLLAPPVEGNSGTVAGGFPKVSDFGLARLAEARPGDSGQLLGTPSYMAPEQAEGRDADIGPPCDVWALGVILYRALTGKLPYGGRNPAVVLFRVIDQPPPMPRSLRPDLPERLESICLACLAKVPLERPTAERLARRLERYLSSSDDDTGPIRPRRPTGQPDLRRMRRIGLVVSLIVGLVGLVVLGVFVSMWASGPAPSHVRVSSFEVRFGPENEPLGEPGRFPRPGDALKIDVDLSAPAHAMLIEITSDGEERLLWPTQPGQAPPLVRSIRFPEDGQPYRLSDNPHGGMHIVAVVAGVRGLPPFEKMRGERPQVTWPPMPPSRTAISAEDGVLSALGGPGHGLPPGKLPWFVEQACKALRHPAADTVRLIVIPIHGEEP